MNIKPHMKAKKERRKKKGPGVQQTNIILNSQWYLPQDEMRINYYQFLNEKLRQLTPDIKSYRYPIRPKPHSQTSSFFSQLIQYLVLNPLSASSVTIYQPKQVFNDLQSFFMIFTLLSNNFHSLLCRYTVLICFIFFRIFLE